MQNISLTKIAGAVKRLESESERNETYKSIVKTHESKLNQISEEIEKIKINDKVNNELNDELNTLSSQIDELKNQIQSITENRTNTVNEVRELKNQIQFIAENKVNDNAVTDLQTEVRELKSELMKTIQEIPIMTYDNECEQEHEHQCETNNNILERSMQPNNNINSSISSQSSLSSLSSQSIVNNKAQLFPLDLNDSNYSTYASLDDVLQINMGNTSFMINRDKNNKQINTILNDIGGLALKKNNSENTWLIDSTNDSEMSFHYNSSDNKPFTITPSEIKTPTISINGKSISQIATAINNETINDKSIPTVNAIVKYINANLQRMGLYNKLNNTADINVSSQQMQQPITSSSVPVKCNISTVTTQNGDTLLIENDSKSISLLDNNSNITPITVSSSHGLSVGNNFKLVNSPGILCKFVSSHPISSLKGKFVELTGTISTKIDDLIIPDVRLSDKLSTMVYDIFILNYIN